MVPLLKASGRVGDEKGAFRPHLYHTGQLAGVRPTMRNGPHRFGILDGEETVRVHEIGRLGIMPTR